MGSDFPFLPPIERNEQKVIEADKSIGQNEGRFFNSLFWFTKINNTDDEAIKSLEAGDYEIAQRIWKEAIDNDDESLEALSWYNNLGTLKLMMAVINKDEGLLTEGLKDKLRLLNDYGVEEFAKQITDKTYQYDERIVTGDFLDIIDAYIVESFNKGIDKVVDLQDNHNYSEYVSGWYSNLIILNIENEIENLSVDRTIQNTYELAISFVSYCKGVLDDLEKIFGTDSHKYHKICDKIAVTLCGISIRYHNHYFDKKRVVFRENALELIEYAESIAKGEETKNYISKECEVVRNNVVYGRLFGEEKYERSSSNEEQTFTVSQRRPWVRFGARVIDDILFGSILGILLLNFYPYTVKLTGYYFTIVASFIFIFVEAGLLSTWGSTPGKSLLKITLRKNNGTKLSYKQALSRSFDVFVRGEGLSIPIVIIITRIVAYNRLMKQGITSWDENGGFNLSHKKVGIFRSIIAILIVIVIGYLYLL